MPFFCRILRQFDQGLSFLCQSPLNKRNQVFVQGSGVNFPPLANCAHSHQVQIDTIQRNSRFTEPHPLAHGDQPTVMHPRSGGFQRVFNNSLFLRLDLRFLSNITAFQSQTRARIRRNRLSADRFLQDHAQDFNFRQSGVPVARPHDTAINGDSPHGIIDAVLVSNLCGTVDAFCPQINFQGAPCVQVSRQSLLARTVLTKERRDPVPRSAPFGHSHFTDCHLGDKSPDLPPGIRSIFPNFRSLRCPRSVGTQDPHPIVWRITALVIARHAATVAQRSKLSNSHDHSTE